MIWKASFPPLPVKYSAGPSMALNNLLGFPRFRGLDGGEPLDIQLLALTSEGKPRLTILWIAHLTVRPNEFSSGQRSDGDDRVDAHGQPGNRACGPCLSHGEFLRLLLFPPSAIRAGEAVADAERCLKARPGSYVVGVHAGDARTRSSRLPRTLDAGTWFSPPADRTGQAATVLDGLEGLPSLRRRGRIRSREMERVISVLGKPRLPPVEQVTRRAGGFITRWALLTSLGPLTREQSHNADGGRESERLGSGPTRNNRRELKRPAEFCDRPAASTGRD